MNGQSIISMPHADIVKLIKDAGLTVTLHIIPEEGKCSFVTLNQFFGIGVAAYLVYALNVRTSLPYLARKGLKKKVL